MLRGEREREREREREKLNEREREREKSIRFLLSIFILLFLYYSLFNGISIFMCYLMPKPTLCKMITLFNL